MAQGRIKVDCDKIGRTVQLERFFAPWVGETAGAFRHAGANPAIYHLTKKTRPTISILFSTIREAEPNRACHKPKKGMMAPADAL